MIVKPLDATIAMLSVPGVNAPGWVIGTCTSVESAAAYIRDPLDPRRIGPLSALMASRQTAEDEWLRQTFRDGFKPPKTSDYQERLRATNDAKKRIKEAIDGDPKTWGEKECRVLATSMEALRNGMPLDEIIADIRQAHWRDRLRAVGMEAPDDPEPNAMGFTVIDRDEPSGAQDTSAPLLVPRVVTMSTVQPERAEWLWRQWIPLGMLSVIDGDPGVGKSTITIDLTARITRGDAMPFATEKRDPADVLLIGAEDHLAMTVRPRLDAANANAARVHVLEAVPRAGDPNAPPTLADVSIVEAIVTEKRIRAIVIDPVMAHLPSGTDAYRDSELRELLTPWAQMAQRTGCAVLAVRHLRKMGGAAIYRGGGSIGMIGAARSALFVGRDPDDPDACVLAHSKGNLAPSPKSLRYRVVDHDGVGRIDWLGVAENISADRLAASPNQHENNEPNPVDAAFEALKHLLADGPRLTKDLERDVRAMTGASPRTIERAREQLRKECGAICRNQSATRGGWTLELPGGGLRSGEDRQCDPGGGLLASDSTITTKSLEETKSATTADSTGGHGGWRSGFSKNAATDSHGGERQTGWSEAVYLDTQRAGLHEDDE